ncbi:acetylornithine aminotransferase [Cephaloticoccus primus]|uniref:Acetylornithine aminotransferase n=1 Tax=Cephaloticoccus primus TaxID=1548207 RepID=A0A139SUJ3_9BACT|nr:aspartate aminotransferase family protein [Cephaloticoccus primus]KXU38204.1 acetylornithine aminotransferase [Cephaloticoccus primus]
MTAQPDISRADTAALYDAHVLKNYARAAITLVRGSGCRAWDDEGRSYLDFSSGVAVSSLGHCHPHWVAAIRRQAGELVHTSNLYRHPNQGELARRLAGYAGPGRLFFCNSGGEADEALIKLSRLYGVAKAGGTEGQCFKVITARGGFHGRMFGGMSATAQEKIQKGFRPLVPGFAVAELNDLDSFAAQMDESTSAVLLETIQGESGINPCTPQFLVGLRKLCDERGILLLLDEVQCGLGRTGTFYAFEAAGIRPDAIAMAKGLGGGFPIGAVWIAERFSELFTPGTHGSTFGGTPLACAAGLAVLDVIEREGLLAKVREQGAEWLAELSALVAEFPQKLADVRGRGYLVGLQFAVDSAPYVAGLRERGLLVVPAGGNVIRVLPPLIATRAELAESVQILRETLRALG